MQNINWTQLRYDLFGLVTLPRHLGPPVASLLSGWTNSMREVHQARKAAPSSAQIGRSALVRSDWKWGILQIIAAACTLGLTWFVFPFIYNRLYLKDLIKKGFKLKDARCWRSEDRSGSDAGAEQVAGWPEFTGELFSVAEPLSIQPPRTTEGAEDRRAFDALTSIPPQQHPSPATPDKPNPPDPPSQCLVIQLGKQESQADRADGYGGERVNWWHLSQSQEVRRHRMETQNGCHTICERPPGPVTLPDVAGLPLC